MKIIRTILILLPALVLGACSSTPQLKENNIDKVIKAMTDEEKAHLIVCANNLNTTLDSTYAPMIAACKDMVPGCGGFTYPIARLGIPSLVLADGPAGLRISPVREGTDSTFYCTGFPIGTSLSATWDPQVARDVAEAIGEELVDYGVDVLLAPGQNLHRNPLCGRNFEYFSEDPLLSGRMSAAYVRGVQANGVAACIKHFAFNNMEINRLSNDSRVSARAARELYLKNFEIAVEEGKPLTLMTSYNYYNGRYTTENEVLLKQVLRGEFGFDGLIMTDWGGGYDPVKMVNASTDLIAPGNDEQYRQVLEGIRSGAISRESADAAVRNVLRLIVRMPAFRNHSKPDNSPDFEAHAAVCRRAGAEGMVLLRNEGGVLPFKPGTKVAMFGANSYKLLAGGTGAGDVNKAHVISLDKGLSESTVVLDGSTDAAYREYLAVEGPRVDAINAERSWWFGDLPYEEMSAQKLRKVVKAASSSADVALVTVIRNAGEGSDRHVENDFNLKPEEKSLIAEVSAAFHKAGKKVVVVLNTTGVLETASWKDSVEGILVAWQPGQEAGYSIADVLTGVISPSGRLPMTFPVSYADVPSQNFFHIVLPDQKNGSWTHHKAGRRYYERKGEDWVDYTEDIYMGYRYYQTFGVGVSYPFGYGLGYTSFEYTDMQVSAAAGGGWDVKVSVRNTGDVPSREVVQLYSKARAGFEAPEVELRAFAKTGVIEPGGTETVLMHLSERDLAYFDESRSAWVTPAGGYELCVARDAATMLLCKTVTVDSEIVRNVTPLDAVRFVGKDGNVTNVEVDSAEYQACDLFIDPESRKLTRYGE